ncbi:MAG: hypothetical protein KAI24_17420 [Planctomycetes bacterium]|nr:hypothetical protein [Planctomycetota bacterium]
MREGCSGLAPATKHGTDCIAGLPTKRLGHSQALLPNGQVLIVSGINGGQLGGGQVPTCTTSCQLADPAKQHVCTDRRVGSYNRAVPDHRARVARRLRAAQRQRVGGRRFVATIASIALNGEMISTRFCNAWDAATGLWPFRTV